MPQAFRAGTSVYSLETLHPAPSHAGKKSFWLGASRELPNSSYLVSRKLKAGGPCWQSLSFCFRSDFWRFCLISREGVYTRVYPYRYFALSATHGTLITLNQVRCAAYHRAAQSPTSTSVATCWPCTHTPSQAPCDTNLLQAEKTHPRHASSPSSNLVMLAARRIAFLSRFSLIFTLSTSVNIFLRFFFRD